MKYNVKITEAETGEALADNECRAILFAGAADEIHSLMAMDAPKITVAQVIYQMQNHINTILLDNPELEGMIERLGLLDAEKTREEKEAQA